MSFDLEAELKKEAEEYLDQVAGRLKAKGLEVETKVLEGYPAAAIAELAKETANGMVVMTSHGRSGLTRWILGSVTESVVRYSGEPVLIVPAAKGRNR